MVEKDDFKAICKSFHDTIPLDKFQLSSGPNYQVQTNENDEDGIEIRDGIISRNKNNSNNQNQQQREDEKANLGDDADDKPCYYGHKSSNNDTLKANKYRKYAIAISWLSIIATLTICIIEFIVSSKENSTSAFGLAFSAVLDLLSSVVVLWRYYKSYDTFSMYRENVSCVVLAVLFILSSVSIGAKAVYNLDLGDTPDYSTEGLRVLVITSIISSVLCFLLLILKLHLSKKLSSRTLFTDAMNSLAAAVIALSIVVTSEVSKVDKQLWYLDSTIGILVAILLLAYGIWLLVKHAPLLKSGN